MPLSRRDFLATTGWSLLAGATGERKDREHDERAGRNPAPHQRNLNVMRPLFRSYGDISMRTRSPGMIRM